MSASATLSAYILIALSLAVTYRRVSESGASVLLPSMVRFINAQSQSEKVEVFRNEDTGWGWPPYMKFNSADITAEAQTFATAEGKPWVLLKYYGWRIHIFDMFPNIISLKQVPRDYNHIPWFNLVFLLVLAGGSLYVIRRSRQLVNKIKARFKRDKVE